MCDLTHKLSYLITTGELTELAYQELIDNDLIYKNGDLTNKGYYIVYGSNNN